MITVTVRRSAEWIAAQQIERGQNIGAEIRVAVEPASLSVAARREIVAVEGKYPDAIPWVGYDESIRISSFSGYTRYGGEYLEIDTDNPTVEQIDAALMAAIARISQKREKAEREKAERDAATQRSADGWAALPLGWRASADGVCRCAPITANPADYRGPLKTSGHAIYGEDVLRQRVPEAYAEAEREVERLRALKAIEDRDLLGEFLSHVPADAKRGALKSMAREEDARDALRQRVEAASPYQVFD